MTVTPERTFISTIFLKKKDYLLLYLSYIIYYNNTIYIYNTTVKYILMFQFSVLKFFFFNISDEDECASNTHGCEYGCRNIDSGFKCTCPSGYHILQQRKCFGMLLFDFVQFN